MTIFTVLLPRPQPALADKITSEFQTDALRISDTQWLVSGAGTAMEISKKLGIADPVHPDLPPIGEGIVFATNGYFGRAPANVWEWIKAKLEMPPRAASG